MRKLAGGAFLALALLACREQAATAPPGEAAEVHSPGEEAKAGSRRDVALLTSLPLVLGEGFSLEPARHPLTQALERRFAVTLVDGPEKLPPAGLLLAIQPQALTAERLVALDRWVREGGRILLLADPRLAWESARPLGDVGRPPVAFPDTGLLTRWGLRLDAPDEEGPAARTLAGGEVLTESPGSLHALPGSTCDTAGDRFVARCTLGRGQAIVVADADFVQASESSGADGPTGRNYEALVAELGALADSGGTRR